MSKVPPSDPGLGTLGTVTPGPLVTPPPEFSPPVQLPGVKLGLRPPTGPLQVTLGVMLLKLLHLENFCPCLRKASTVFPPRIRYWLRTPLRFLTTNLKPSLQPEMLGTSERMIYSQWNPWMTALSSTSAYTSVAPLTIRIATRT